MLRKTVRIIHLYMGLFTGLVVFIVAITGCCWVFQDEINAILEEELIITRIDQALISPTRARSIAASEFPNRHIHGVLYENEDNRLVEVIFYEAEPKFFYSIFLNPYTGKILRHEDHYNGFFAFVLDGHQNLWLPPAIGRPIVSYSTLVFLFSIITGIILWWPRRNKKQRLTFDWKNTTRWKRKNFDLHAVVGFYISGIAMVFVITGLVMTFNWFYFLYYTAIGGTSEMRFVVPPNQSEKAIQKNQQSNAIDYLPLYLKSSYPAAKDFEIHYPDTDSASIYVEISNSDGLFYDSDYRFYDQITLNEIETSSIYGKYENADNQDKLMRMNYDIHVGAILGFAGKILACIASLITASLPVTGVLLWWGRSKKSKRSSKRRIVDSSMLST